ncbi:MAG: hypothetical protein JKY56_24025, partial [Kofleriaceae bacterium]|nr:hypothetical protein [Kofleriaceae bacterium]
MTEVESLVLHDAPDADDAKHRLERIFAQAERQNIALDELNAETQLVLALCCQRAPYLATLLARAPARLLRVGDDAYLHRAKSK